MCLIPYAVLDRIVADGVDVSALFRSAEPPDAEGNDCSPFAQAGPLPQTAETARAIAARAVSGSFNPSDRSVSIPVSIPVRSINRIVPEGSSA